MLPNIVNRIGPLSCNGVTTTFSFTNLKIYDADDLKVVHTDASGTETTLTRVASSPSTDEYTLTGTGLDAGGSITTGSTYASGETITMVREMTFDQQRGMSNVSVPRGDTIETMIDEVTMMVQELEERVDRNVSIAVSDSGSLTLPTAATRANKFLAFDETGDAIEATSVGTATVTSFMETVLDDTTAAAALTTLGMSAYAQTLLDDATAAAALTTLGVSAYAQTLLDDAAATNVMTTLGFSANAESLVTAADYAAMLALFSPLTANGDLWTRASGVDAAFPIGSAYEVLRANAAGTGLEWALGGWQHVESVTAMETGSPTEHDFDLTAGYSYMLVYDNISHGSGTSQRPAIRFRQTAGSAWVDGSNTYVGSYTHSSSTGANDALFTSAALGASNYDSSYENSGLIFILSGGATDRKTLISYTNAASAGNYNKTYIGSAVVNANEAHDKFRVLWTGDGTFDTGTIHIYRLKEGS